ncbi:aldehyde dehydrogenase family protein [Bacteriovorax sp. Seq25_V]|uniref:aldehyde dehydrogenase family protein n=1 Tax=Bacteriovorax sp. Seq25_V TaxID=1201288 RepID=UPI00038A21A5|nr:aldehyde dehydrogenase family protein [Bacteriovorax sp. Seq25_V]EQC43330.1 putative succinylglutamate-semialdehyde dehydrogenase [Bacteriovorax sp. Seq25_V]
MFKLLGNYYYGKYTQPITTGAGATEIFIKRECPSDTDITLWTLPVDYSHVDDVIESSVKGFKTWRNTSLEERIQILRNYQSILKDKFDDIAKSIALEVGKPLWEAKTEANSLIAKVDVTISDSLPRIESKTFNNIMPDTNGYVHFKPIGPSLIIGPFNFPCHLANGQILSALISGNSIIFKPSEKTCYSSQLMFDCLAKAGFPEGVVNLIQGDGETARRLLKSKEIKGVFFTGSKDVGLKILEATHSDLSKLVSLELGGKNTAIVDETADLDFALEELIKGAFLTAGQRCTSTAIVAIHESIADDFINRFHDLAKRLIVDHPLDSEVEPFMGPLIDQRSVDQYLLFMGMAKREGIQEIMRGKHLEKAKHGYYVTPSIHRTDKFDPKSHFLTSEIFGPNCTFITYKNFEDAIDIANSTEYGLAASVFTKDPERFKYAVQNIDSGLINLNRSTVGASAKLPFGGVKNSGNYHPAAVTTIDSCVYQMATLEIYNTQATGNIPGLMNS